MAKSGGSAPKPPKISVPAPSAEEQALLQQQIRLASQLETQSAQSFGQGQDDRNRALGYLQTLQKPPQLSGEELSLINNLTDSLYQQQVRQLTEGSQRALFDTAQRDTLGYLANSGTLNSTTSNQLLGDLGKEQLRYLNEASYGAANQNMQLQLDAMNRERGLGLDLFRTLYGGGNQSSAMASSLASQAGQLAGQVGGQFANQRNLQYQNDIGNAQAQYQYDLGNYQRQKQRRSGFGGTAGGLLGAGLGLGLAPFTGGSSLLLAGIGGTAGFGLGSSLF
jgi:hypothetical protein